MLQGRSTASFSVHMSHTSLHSTDSAAALQDVRERLAAKAGGEIEV
jgi:hypothetical protein